MIPEIGNVNVNNVGVPNVGVGVVGVNGVSNIPINSLPSTSVTDVDVQQVNDTTVRPIGVRGPQTIRVADNRIWVVNSPNVQQLEPPVVVTVGTPIVNIAGCVETHKENTRGNRNKQLVDNDPKGNTVLCDSGAPNFIPPNYESNRLKWETFYGEPPNVDKGVKTEPPPPPKTPDTPDPPPAGGGDTKEDPPCPGPMAPRIGDVAQNMKEKVSGFELQRDPRNPDGEKICVTLYEDIGVVEAFLPTPQVITTTAVIATVATGSALLAKPLADLLLKVVKPVVKKAIAAIQKKLGKTPYRPTLSEVRTNRYREKKGMLGINFAKQRKPKDLKKE